MHVEFSSPVLFLLFLTIVIHYLPFFLMVHEKIMVKVMLLCKPHVEIKGNVYENGDLLKFD